ncbi:hypothetical protein [Candidatus Poriferisodalis sp.]|uniref:hypothetical protein n=1 Tax=Candidatus Poriferisodalis sp. TaxID=3101277 RepID=UPI003B51C8A8
MPATPRTHRPAPLRLVDASPARGRLHRSGGIKPSERRGTGNSGMERPSRTGVVADASGQFVLTVRALTAAARDLGLSVPAFQSPPRSEHLTRSILRRAPDDCVVAVRVRGRPFGAVAADAIDGVVACNDLGASVVGAVRDALWCAVESLWSGSDYFGADAVRPDLPSEPERGTPQPGESLTVRPRQSRSTNRASEPEGSHFPLDEAA